MAIFTSKVDKNSSLYLQNFEVMQGLVQDLKSKIVSVQSGGGPEAMSKHLARGKMPARERIMNLLDPGSPFLELSPLAALNMYADNIASAGIITGIGKVQGRTCMIVANDATVKGGTYFPITAKKHLRAQEIALENHLPCFYLVDSGGAHLPHQDEVFPDRDHFGRIFYNQARMSALKIPQVAIVMGSCTAGGAYVPAMADQTIIVKGTGTIFLGGPPLVKAATGEVVDAQALGGADVHGRQSGLVDYVAESDGHALAIARQIATTFREPRSFLASYREPTYDPEDLYGIIPSDLSQPYDVREILVRLVDGSEFEEFKELYGATLVCAFATLYGQQVGIIANNGILFSESALKGAHFIELCSQRQIPLIFLQNISGFMVGRKYEASGIAKDGAKMVHAVACSSVPKYTVIIGGSFGAGTYAMCGRAYSPRFLWTWPNARISVMGGDQAAAVLTQIKRESLLAKGKAFDEKEALAYANHIREEFNRKGHPYYATARLWDDGILDPLETRRTLGMAVAFGMEAPQMPTQFGVFRM